METYLNKRGVMGLQWQTSLFALFWCASWGVDGCIVLITVFLVNAAGTGLLIFLYYLLY